MTSTLVRIKHKELFKGIKVKSSDIASVDGLYNVMFGSSRATPYRITDRFRYQLDVPILKIHAIDGVLDYWVLYLADIGEVRKDDAEIHFKGVISSSPDFADNTPFTQIVCTKGNKYVVISYGGYANLIKPKE